MKSGKIWSEFQTLKLYINMRTGEGEREFSEWLLKLGQFKKQNYFFISREFISLNVFYKKNM